MSPAVHAAVKRDIEGTEESYSGKESDLPLSLAKQVPDNRQLCQTLKDLSPTLSGMV